MRADWADFPEAAARSERRSTIMRPACNGPIEWKDRTAIQKDIANFKTALESAKPADAFMTAASPGVIAHFLKNQHYPSRDAYLSRLADFMTEEYDSIHRAGFVLQIDCPDLAMGRHLAFLEVSNAEFLKIAAGQHRGLELRPARHPGRPHVPAPLLGQLRRGAPSRHPAARTPAGCAEGEASGDVLRGREPAP